MGIKEKEIFNELESIKKVFSNTIPCEIKTNINYDNQKTDFNLVYLIYCSFCKKSLVTNIHIYEYYNKYVFRLRAFITDESNYSFDLWNYLVYKNIIFDKNIFSFHIPQNEWYNTIHSYVSLITSIINKNEMQQILNTDYEPEIPIDWSRCGYK